jgi:hypothetical protein
MLALLMLGCVCAHFYMRNLPCLTHVWTSTGHLAASPLLKMDGNRCIYSHQHVISVYSGCIEKLVP